ncbi:hypothetical protein FSP39_020011 [Pinctada imbricata]|uniref:ADP-ribosylation factor-like protein 6 n=1 Tax=Pinctada imbricata TaxID=66713 RepID=A0AA88XS74_PINIB|nr:hypothetical protein FSP39_020011 [Pinctada imbricata]
MGNKMDKCRPKHDEPLKLLIQGSSSAGKTTIMYRLKTGEVVETFHTTDSTCECIYHGSKQIALWDVGGRDSSRIFYRFHYFNTDALVFVIDSSERLLFSEVKEDLELTMSEKELKKCPFVILANKQDVPGAMTMDEIAEKLDLQNMKAAKGKKWAIFPTSALTGEGFSEALDWITDRKWENDHEESKQGNGKSKQFSKTDADIAFFKKAVLRMRSILLD